MQTVRTLFDLAGGRPLPEAEDGPARRVQLMLLAVVATMVLAALYGLAAGSTQAALAVANLYKLPMILVLSGLCAVPAGLVAWKLSGAAYRATDLLLGLASGNLAAALVLAVLSPLVALYYHTSGFLGGVLAVGASAGALAVGLAVLLRTIWTRVAKEHRTLALAIPVAVVVFMQLATLVQLIFVAAPIIPEVTVFDGGLDSMLR